MRMLCRILAIAFLAVAFGLFLRDAAAEGPLALSPLGQVWYSLDPGSLNLIQAVVQRYLTPALWDGVILPALLWPAVIVFLVPGLLFALAGFWPRRD